MIFTRNNDTITATATTAGVGESLLGLENVEGVVLSFKGLKRVYTMDFSNARLDIVGTGAWLIIDPEFEELIYRTDHANDCLRPLVGTLFQVGVMTVVNGITRYSKGDALTMPKDSTAQSTINSLSVNGGRFEWYGGTIYAGDAMGCSIGSTAEIFAGRFVTTSVQTNTTAASAMVMRNDGDPNDVICHGVELDSLNPTTSAPIVFSRNGLNTFVFTALTGAVQQRTGTWTNALILRGASFSKNAFSFDYNFVGANNSYSLDRVQPAEFFNLDVGTGLRQFSATNNLNGHISFFQDFKSVVTDINGNPIEAAVTYIGTTDNGNRVDDARPLFQNSRTFSNNEFDSYTSLSDSQGESDITVLTGRMWVRSSNSEQLDLYSLSGIAGVDDFVVSYADYNSLPSFTPITMHSSEEIVDNKSLLPDSQRNEPDINIARAYTVQDTPSKIYDQLKAAWLDNYQGAQETTVTKVLTNINARDLDVVIKGQTTGQATLIGNTLTFHAPIFQGSITTTGTVTLTEGASVSGGFIDSNGVVAVFNGFPTGTGKAIAVIEELDDNDNSLNPPVFINLTADEATGSVQVALELDKHYRFKTDANGHRRGNNDNWTNFIADGAKSFTVDLIEITDATGGSVYGQGDPTNLANMDFDVVSGECRFLNTTGSEVTFTFFDAFDFLEDKITTHGAIQLGLRQFDFDIGGKILISPAPALLSINDDVNNTGRCSLDFVVIEAGQDNPRSMLATPFNSVYGLEMAHTIITAETSGLLREDDERLDELKPTRQLVESIFSDTQPLNTTS